MADNSEKIAQLRALIDAGIKRTRTDRHETEFDLDFLQQRLRELEAEDAGSNTKRPVAATINLSGF